jgi:uncharacterized membrane protein
VRKLWFRASLFSLLAVATALVALLAKPLIPDDWPSLAGADAVDGILGILAASMLTVTVFSLTTMVAAYSAAASNVTPRATRLLLEDSTSQNALSTFLGAFLFALVGIIALSTGLYGENGRLVLFVVTLLVVVVIVVTLLRWIVHLSTLGQVGDTIGRVERAATDALDERIDHPWLGGAPLGAGPPSGHAVYGESIGYVLHVDMEALARAAGERDTVCVAVLPGTFVHSTHVLARTSFEDEERQKAVRRAFSVGRERRFDQDPRFGLIVLSEIASRALSPAVNDPGTAIAVIGAGVRILSRWNRRSDTGSGPEVRFPRVFAPALALDDLFDDMFAPVARDGAALVEVGVRLQKALAMLAAMGDDEMRRAARRESALAMDHAAPALKLESERRRLAELATLIA